jgi:hypothetical protein
MTQLVYRTNKNLFKAYYQHASGFRSLCAVFGPRFLPVCYTGRIQSAAHDMVPYTGQILDSAAAHENYGVFLEVVPNSWYVGCYFIPVCQSNTRHLPQSRIGLLGGRCVNTHANPSLLRRSLQSRAFRFFLNFLPPYCNQLTDCWQSKLLSL